MSFYMMHSYQWFMCRKSKSFCKGNPDKQCSDKSWPVGHRYSCYVIKGYSRLGKCLLRHLIYLFHVFSGC